MNEKDRDTFRIMFSIGAFLPLLGLVFEDLAAIGWIGGVTLMFFILAFKLVKHGQAAKQ